jgi:iron-sulfur cluster repair protein YtfE (RIC family)
MPARRQAPPAEEQAAMAAIEQHHEQLARGLWERTEWLLRSAEDYLLAEAEQDRQDLLTYLRQELVPHVRAEEQTLYPAAAALPDMKPLLDAMIVEHRAISAGIDELAATGSIIRAAGAATGIAALFAVHLAKENDLLLPALAASAEVSLAALLEHMHEHLDPAGPEAAGYRAGTGPAGSSTFTPTPHSSSKRPSVSGCTCSPPGR